jgi:hypothetical protein
MGGMAEGDDAVTDTPPTEPAPSPTDWSAPDATLQFLVNLLNRTGESGGRAGMSITFASHGYLVSGVLISRREWFELQNAAFRSTMGEVGEALADAFDRALGEPNADDDTDSSEITYIHLKETEFYLGGEDRPIGGALWRGRLSEIGGFTLGQLRRS